MLGLEHRSTDKWRAFSSGSASHLLLYNTHFTLACNVHSQNIYKLSIQMTISSIATAVKSIHSI